MRRILAKGVWVWGALFCGWFLFYWLTAPVVHVEADDAYEYAYNVEKSSFLHLVHPYHPLHLPAMRLLFGLGKSMGLVNRSLPLIVFFGAVSAAAAVVLFSLLLWKRVGVRKWRAIVAGGLLGLSYGFWRYAAESETYALASLLVLGLVWWTFKWPCSIKHAAIGGLFGVLAVFGHVLSLIPALGSVPLYLGLRNGKKHVIAYLAVFMLVSAPAAYTIEMLARVEYPEYATLAQLEGPQMKLGEPKDWVHGGLVVGHVVATGNFLFSFPRFDTWIDENFPGRRLEEEKFAGARAWAPTGKVGFATLLLVIVAFAATLYDGVTRALPRLSDPVVLASLLWLLLYVLVIAYMRLLDQPEAWLLPLVPFWLLFARVVHVEAGNSRVLLATALPVALLIHNGLGGMAMLQDPESDRYRLKAHWLLENAKEGDIILTSESGGFSSYLRYYSTAEITTLHQRSVPEATKVYQELMRSPERVFVTGEIVDPPSFMKRSPEPWMRDSDLIVRLFRESTQQVYQDDWGGVYLLKKP